MNKISLRLVMVAGLAAILAVAFWTLPAAAACDPGPAAPSLAPASSSALDGVPGARFVHVATTDNTIGNQTTIDHPLTNDAPDALLFVTQNATPGGVFTGGNNHTVGVYFDDWHGQWVIQNEDENAMMPPGAAFNVLIPDPSVRVIVHAATADNIEGTSTYIDHPVTNGNPNAIVFVTHNLSPEGESWNPDNNHPIAVRYDHDFEQWAIVNQDGAFMPQGADFNVLIPASGPEVFTHSVASTTSSASTLIDHPLTNNKPYAILTVTQNYNPGGAGGTYNYHAISLIYVAVAGKWAIWNQDGANIPPGAAFNVMVPTSDTAFVVHEATDVAPGSYATYLDHPLTNGNRHAIPFATHNWNPGGGGTGLYNDHPIAMRYWAGLWGIWNQDMGPISEGSAFNVLIPNLDAGVFYHKATVSNTDGTSTYLDYPLTNRSPDALVFVTQNLSPSGVATDIIPNAHPTGVWYNDGREQWAIFNQDYLNMEVGAVFNVLVPCPDASVFVHQATEANTFGNWTTIDHPLANGHPGAALLVTQNYNPGGVIGARNAHEIGVYYQPHPGRWAIYNEDRDPMPDGAAFNVLVSPYRIHLPLVARSS